MSTERHMNIPHPFSDDRFRTVIENSAAGYFFIDADGLYRAVNASWLRMHKYDSPQEILGRDFSVTQTESDYEKACEMVERLLSGQTINEGEFSRRCKDGSIGWHIFSANPFRQNGEITGIEGFLIDITDRKHAEASQRTREEKFLTFTEQTGDLVSITDENGIIVYVSPVSRDIFQYEPEEMCGHHFMEFLDSSDIPQAKDAFRKAVDCGTRTRKLELRMKRKDESLFWGELNGAYIRFGETDGLLAVIRDITERKQAEEALRESETKYRTLFEHMRQGVFFQQANGEFSDVNRAALDILGMEKSQFIGSDSYNPKFEVIDGYGNPLPPECHPSIVALKTGEAVRDYTLAFRNQKNNTLRWLIVNAIPQFRPGETAPYQVFVSMHDITEHRLAEEALAEEAVRRHILIDQSRDGIVLIDNEGKVFESNQQFAKMLGYSHEEVLGLHVWDWDDQWSRDELLGMIRSVDETGAHFETRHRSKDGSSLDVEISTNGAMCGGQKLVFCVCRDISERKKAEEALRESEAMYRALVNGLPDIVMRFDRKGRHLFVSENVIDVVDLNAEQFTGKTHRELGFPDSYCELWEQVIDKVFSKRTPIDTEFSYDGKGGERLFNWRLIPEFDDQGIMRSVLSISRDITAHRRAGQNFQMLFRQMLDGFAVHEIICCEAGKPVDYRFLAVNPAFEHMTGLRADVLVGRNVLEVMPGTEPYWIETYGKVALTGEPVHFENYHAELDKHFKVTAFRPAKNQFACIFSDITGRKKAEQELKESEERYRTYISNILDVIVILDADLVIKYKSPNITRHFGWLPEELIGKTGWETVHPEDREYIGHELGLLLEREGNTRTVQYRYLCKDGSYKYIELYAVNMVNDPVIQGILGNYHDITDQRNNAMIVRESEEKFRLAFKTSPDAVNISKMDGTFIEINLGFTRVTGFTEEDVLGKTSLEIGLWVKEEDRRKLVEELRVHGSVSNLQADFRCKDGVIKTSIMSASIITIRNEPCIISITRDITERIKLEEQLLQAQKMEAVGRLAGGVAHDFNNLLSIVIGNTELALASVDPGDTVHDNLDDILKAAERSTALTRQLLAFARKQTISPRVLDLNATVEKMTKMLQRLIGEDIKLTWSPGSELWPVKIDPSQVDQILANLCVNARDAISDVGSITIRTGNGVIDEAFCRNHRGFVTGEYVLLMVIDDGCGMDQEIQANLFEPFFTTKELGKGTGLGLATVYGIVKQNNGFISVSSEPGMGTTFTIYFPRHNLKPAFPASDGVTTGKTLHGDETILIVEDEPAILHMTRTMLEQYGYFILSANTPGDAIDLAVNHEGRIHMLITDVVMPEMNGRDLVRNLIPLFPGIKQLFMSGYTANVIAHHGVLDEGVSFIQKPFSINDLAVKVREVLDNP